MLPARTGQLTGGRTYVGVDFGTSTTVVSVASLGSGLNDYRVSPVRLPQKMSDGARHEDELLPTVMAYYNGTLLVGAGAAELKCELRKGRDLWYSFKMELGADMGDKYYESALLDNEHAQIRTAHDCARVFFMYLKGQLLQRCHNQGLSEELSWAVSIPASFEANQRRDLVSALLENGIEVGEQALIDEPNAAFMSYVYEANLGEKPLMLSPLRNSTVLVFDFGAGTCDISVLEIGQGSKGMYSKNLAISKFTELGGDNVDHYIASHYLLPRLLEYNDRKAGSLNSRERGIEVESLLKLAERLKVLCSKRLSPLQHKLRLPAEVRNSRERVSVKMPYTCDAVEPALRQEEFFLTCAEFAQTMAVFTHREEASAFAQRMLGGQAQQHGTTDEFGTHYESIFTPIESALQKANVAGADLDYVLFIGGSAQNPFIQEALLDYFNKSEMLVPRDLQCHVSQGAALHSLLFNGLGQMLMRPITSEPIFVVTADAEGRSLLFPASAPLPSGKKVIDNLCAARNGQRALELPICVGSVDKMLYNVVVNAPTASGFTAGTRVRLTLELTADKLLRLKAECQGIVVEPEAKEPFANLELTNRQRQELAAEREFNNDAAQHGGQPSKQAFNNLANAYYNAEDNQQVAETREECYKRYHDNNDLSNIAVGYNNAGNYDKSIEFFKRARQAYPNNAHIAANLANTYKNNHQYTEAEKWCREALRLAPEIWMAHEVLARLLESRGETAEAEQHRRKAFARLNGYLKRGQLGRVNAGWLRSIARDLGEAAVAAEAQRISDGAGDNEGLYDSSSLTRSSRELVDD